MVGNNFYKIKKSWKSKDIKFTDLKSNADTNFKKKYSSLYN